MFIVCICTTKKLWNCAFTLNRLLAAPCLNEYILKRVYLYHFTAVTCSQAVYPYVMEWEVEKILQLFSQDCRCKWQTNKQWACHDAVRPGVVVVGLCPGLGSQDPSYCPARSRASGGTRTAPALGIRHLPGHRPRYLRDHSPLQSPTDKGTATILSMETYPDMLPIGYSWKTITSMKYLQFLTFRGISKHALLQPSHKYFAPPFPLCNVDKLFRTFKYVFQFVFMKNV